MMAHTGQWMQTRRRLDWMLGPLCVLVAIAAAAVYQLTGRWSAFGSVALACGIWLWFRRTLPAEGRTYAVTRSRIEHAYMLFVLCAAAPALLAIVVVDWLGVQPAAWIFFGILAAFLAVMIGGGHRFEQRLHRETNTESAETVHQLPGRDPQSDET